VWLVACGLWPMAISRGDWIKLAVVLVLVTIGNVAFWQLRGQADVDSATRPSRGRMMKYDTVPPHARVPPKNPMKMAPVDAGQAMMTMMDELEVDEGPYSKLDALPLARTRSDYDELCGKPAASSATSKSDEQLLLIVPIRNRPEQQRHFIDHIYRFMCEYHRLPNGTMTAGVHEYDWRVLFVEQDPHDGLLFNRAKLLNAGYRVAHSRKLWNNCVQGTEHALEPLPTFQTLVLHDVDMLPFPPNRPAHYWSNDRIVHLASAVEEHGYRLPYASYVGGVLVVPDRLWHGACGVRRCTSDRSLTSLARLVRVAQLSMACRITFGAGEARTTWCSVRVPAENDDTARHDELTAARVNAPSTYLHTGAAVQQDAAAVARILSLDHRR